MDLFDAAEDRVPVRTAKVGWRAEAGDGVDFGVGIVDHDIRGLIRFYLRGEILVNVVSRSQVVLESMKTYKVNLNVAVHILLLDGHQQATEPLEAAKVSDNPEEVNLS